MQRFHEDPKFRRRYARNQARHVVHKVLRDQPDMSEEDPEALGHDFILNAVAEDSSHFDDPKEVKRRG